MAYTFYSGNSQYIEIDGLKDQSTTPPSYVNDATLTATLTDRSGNPIAGAMNMPGVYQASSNGVYRFSIDPTQFNPAAESGCTLTITGTRTNGSKYFVQIPNNSIKLRTTGLET